MTEAMLTRAGTIIENTINNFLFNNNVLGGRRCIIEDFLSSGRLPVNNARDTFPLHIYELIFVLYSCIGLV